MIRDKDSTIPDAVLQGLIDRLVGADRLIALVAIADAVARSGDPGSIAKASDALAKGNRALSNGMFESAIEHYREAWKHALKA